MNERTYIKDQTMDEERALYHLMHADIEDCTFAGPADGESVLKEAADINMKNCRFSLRYPLWHVKKFDLKSVDMDELTRAAIWYSSDGVISDSRMLGIKAVRESSRITVTNSHIESPEFGWKSDDITLTSSSIDSEYLFFDSSNIHLKDVKMSGKYSFQYVDRLSIEDTMLDTKDAFWHSHDVTVKNSTVKGEYLGWFSDGLTLINCRIIGTQPLCYCKNLKLINCTMKDTDLAFEYSDVTADIRGHVDSIKNPRSGTITVDSVGEIITEDPVMECTGEVIIR